MNNMTPDEILDEIERLRKSNNILKDEKVKPLSDYEISRLPKVPTEWKWVLINDISTFITNGVHTPTGPEDTNGYGLHCLRITDIQGNADINYESLPYCLRIVESDYDKKLRKGDIYFSFTGNNLGKRYIVKEDRDDTVYAHYFVRWHPLIVNPYYVYYVAHSKVYDQFIQEHQLGSTQPNLKVTDLKRFPIPLCDLVTQNKIATFLKNIEDKISINNQINRNLFEQAKLLYKSRFIDFDDNEGVMPEDWYLGTVSEIIELHDSKRKPLSGNVRDKLEKIYPYYGATSIMDYVDDYLFDGIYLLLGEDGSVIDSEGYPILQYVFGKFWCNNHAHIISGKNGFSVEMLYLLFSLTHVNDIVTGAVQLKISQQNLNKVEAVIPSLGALKDFDDLIQPMFAQIRKLHLENDNLTALRDSLLPKLMSGELDVNELDI